MSKTATVRTKKTVQTKTVRTKIRLNPAVCDGFGFCCEILPEVIGRDEWGFPVLGDGTVPQSLRRTAEQAVAFCPRKALWLETTGCLGTTGRVERTRTR
ncbi:MAG TPA: ferredoxin [Acidimicrobiales bacterium]